MFESKLNSKDFNWRAVEFVQSCVKDPVGVGRSIFYQFFAPLDETSDETAKEEIDYGYKELPDDLVLL